MPPPMPAETSELVACLDAQRRHVVGIIDELDEIDLRTSLVPSGWTPLGMVQHLTLDVERFWFLAVVAGDRRVIDELDRGDDSWNVIGGASGAAVFEKYLATAAEADQILRSVPLDAKPLWWPNEKFGDWRLESVREIVLHVIEETACHAGHLDVMRELLDGKQWVVQS